MVPSTKSKGKWCIALIVAFLAATILIQPGSAQPSQLVSRSAPKVRVTDSQGGVHEIPLPGKVNIVVFWNAKYRLSIDALLAVQRLLPKYGGQAVFAIGINDLGESSSTVNQVAQQRGIVFPLAAGPEASAASAGYRVKGTPVVFVIDRRGVITYAREGYDQRAESDIDSQVLAAMR